MLTVGVDVLPPLPKDAGDRNRTSPFAFTGNRFEFRAVGSNQSIAGPLVAMNTIVAESIDYCATRLEDATKGEPDALHRSVQTVLTEIIDESSPVIFNGDGYSDALPLLQAPQTVELFTKYGVSTERELESRFDTYLEQYCMTVSVEANLTVEIGKTMIFPAAIRYQNELVSTCANLKLAGHEFDTDTLDRVTGLVKSLQDSLAVLERTIGAVRSTELVDEARHYGDIMLPAMDTVREYPDQPPGRSATLDRCRAGQWRRWRRTGRP